MAGQLGIGVIGLGRRWRRYARALAVLRKEVAVRAVCDPSIRRAEQEAQRLGCQATSGVIDLLDRAEVQAVLILDPGWLGVWPLEQAYRLGKPVLWAGPVRDPERWMALYRQYLSGPLIRPVLSARLEQLLGRLDRALEGLGPVHHVRLTWRGNPDLVYQSLLDEPLVPALLLACGTLFTPPHTPWEEPNSVRALMVPGASRYAQLLLGYSGGRVAQLTGWRGQEYGPRLRIEVETKLGLVQGELPGEVCRYDAGGRHTHQPPRRWPELQAIEDFLWTLKEGQPTGPGLAEVCSVLRWLQQGRCTQSDSGLE